MTPQNTRAPFARTLQIVALLGAFTTGLAHSAQAVTVDEVIQDSSLSNEVTPHNSPSHWGWRYGPERRDARTTSESAAISTWGYVFPVDPGNSASNTRVQLRNLKLYALGFDGTWTQLQNTNSIAGEERYSNDTGALGNGIRRPESEGYSYKPLNGRCYHFWAERGWINGANVKGVYATVEARLIKDDPNGPDDRASANFGVNVGADHYRGDWSWIGDLGIGRMKRVTSSWRSFNWTTVPDADFRANPAPDVGSATDALTALTAPSNLAAGQSYNVSVTYGAAAARDIILELKEYGGGWTVYASQLISVAAGSGTANFSINVPASAVGSNRYWYAFEVPSGGDWWSRVADRTQTGVTVDGGYRKVRSRWVQGDGVVRYINNESNVTDPVVTGIVSGWHSAQWAFENQGNGYYKIKNRWQQTYLHVENGDHTYVNSQTLPGDGGWHSAQWSLIDMGGGYQRIRNRWQGTYLNHEFGTRLRSLNIDAGAHSNQWVLDNP